MAWSRFFFEAERLKRGFIDPEDLSQRLGRLKPADNFELRDYQYPPLERERSPSIERLPTICPEPDWLLRHRDKVLRSRSRLGNHLTECLVQKINQRWSKIIHNTERQPTPELHLLRDMERSPQGIEFPWFLVKGLHAIRRKADEQGESFYEEEHDLAEVQKQHTIELWMEGAPDVVLSDDTVSIYRTWPTESVARLDMIDQEAVRRGRMRYIALLEKTEADMQELVAFWRTCGLITDQGIALPDLEDSKWPVMPPGDADGISTMIMEQCTSPTLPMLNRDTAQITMTTDELGCGAWVTAQESVVPQTIWHGRLRPRVSYNEQIRPPRAEAFRGIVKARRSGDKKHRTTRKRDK